MKYKRTNYKKPDCATVKKRNDEMYVSYLKLSKSGKYGTMQIYEILADAHGISERNSVGGIIRKMKKELETETN